MKAIKLYAKETIIFKSDNEDYKDNKYIMDYLNQVIKYDIQCCQVGYSYTKRKNKPYDIHISYYSIDTIKEMIRDLGDDTNDINV